MRKRIISLMSLVLAFSIGFAKNAPAPDEGMWLPMFFKQLNYSTMQQMGLRLTAEELYSFNNSSLKDAIVQMGQFCTGEIVSEKGLMFTNHHCGYDAIAGASTVEHDYLSNGFWAYSMEEEIPIPGLYVSFLVRMEDVTKDVLGEHINAADKTPYEKDIQKNIAELQMKHSEDGRYIVEIKPFFEGLEYYMFIYERFTDVRLVGAPPSSIGKFGGDTDNWMWPRHTGDFSIFRVYANKDNKPADYSKDNVPYKPKHFLPISIKGVQKDDFTMIWGYPGSTERYMTSFEVKNTIDVSDPAVIAAGEALLPVMKSMMDKSDAVRLKYASDYASYMNLWKNKKGELRGLKRLDVYGKKKAIEDRLADWISEDASRRERYGNVLSDLRDNFRIVGEARRTRNSWYGNLGLMCSKTSLTAFRTSIYLSAIENQKEENPMRTEMFKSLITGEVEELFATTDPETEKVMFKALCDVLSTAMGVQVIDKKYKGDVSRFVDDAFKKSVFRSKEAFDKFMKKPSAKKLQEDPIAKIAMLAVAMINESEPQLDEAEKKIEIARPLFIEALRQMDPKLVQYPDANFTMRVTYGKVLDYYPADAVHYDYVTTIDGLMAKEDPTSDEFTVPKRLKELYEAKDYGRYADKDGRLITCFLSNNDITGGNSGSPIINADGHLIGLAFDGNWEAMSGDIAFEPELQRTINVDARYVLFIIDKFAGAKNLIDELKIVE